MPTPDPRKPKELLLGCGELYSVFNIINFENYKNLLYIKPSENPDFSKIRPLIYQPGDLILWKSYFTRYQ